MLGMHTTSKYASDPDLSAGDLQLELSLEITETAGYIALTLRDAIPITCTGSGLARPVNVLNLGEHKLQSTHEDDPRRLRKGA